MHLTNYSINKTSKHFIKNKDNDETSFSSKQSLKQLKERWKEIGVNSDEIFESIKDIVIKACISAETDMLNPINK